MSRDFTPGYPNNPSDTLNEVASDAKETVSNFASQAKDKAAHLANSASESAGRQRENAAKGLHRAASAMQDNAGKLGNGRASDAVRKVAGGMDSTARYLEEHDFADMGKDAMNVARRHPAEAIIASLAIGFLVGRALKR